MEYKDAIESLELKFTSSNEYPVQRATILAEEWEVIKHKNKLLLEVLDECKSYLSTLWELRLLHGYKVLEKVIDTINSITGKKEEEV